MARVKESPALTWVFFAIYAVECLGCYGVLRGVTVVDRPALLVLPVAMLGVLITLRLSKFVGGGIAGMFGANKTNRRKFSDQTWQLVIHLSMTALEMYVLSDEEWYSRPSTCFSEYDPTRVEKMSVLLLYIIQLAIWIITCFSHHFLEARHKDFYLMCGTPWDPPPGGPAHVLPSARQVRAPHCDHSADPALLAL